MSKRNAQALAARARKAGPHSGKRRPDVFDAINGYGDAESEKMLLRWASENFAMGEQVKVVNGKHAGEQARVVLRRDDKGDQSYGVVFDWDMNMTTCWYAGKDLERI